MEIFVIGVAVGIIFFFLGFGLAVETFKDRVENGLVPFIDASGSLAWKKHE